MLARCKQRTKATTAEATVMERAVQGSWPRLTKKLVQTIAPRPLETISYCAQTRKTVQLCCDTVRLQGATSRRC